MNYDLYNPEMWGGIECTINRIGDSFRDQLKYTGHYEREDDIDKIAQLRIRKLRYPVLWEAHQFNSPEEKINWSYTERRLQKIRSLHIEPIAGLLHHGGGPSFTGLLHEEFPELLAAYATKVAEKFPWINYYTPVNEPLTTARFSGLYGLWYPHEKNELNFFSMFLNELKAIVLSMEAIRKINSNAKLVQTEDLARIHSTPLLQYQADFENQRRWLTYDFLCGKVNRNHFFWHYLISLGILEIRLEFFLDHPSPPDIAGFNYYVTSERFLDEKINLYPNESHGGNGQQSYVDVAAVRCTECSGLATLLKEAWQRYHLPMALTEVHLNCTREEQLRWFKDSWDICCELLKENINVKAITAWSIFGAYDWNSLLTKEDKNYETGVFEINEGSLRATAMAKLIRSLATTGSYEHPILFRKGWWRKDQKERGNCRNNFSQPLLIVEEDPIIGKIITEICKRRRIDYCLFPKSDSDISDQKNINEIIQTYNPWSVVIAGTYTGMHFVNHRVRILIITGRSVFKLRENYPEALIVDPETLEKTEFDIWTFINRSLDLLIDEEAGLWRFSSNGMLVRYQNIEARRFVENSNDMELSVN